MAARLIDPKLAQRLHEAGMADLRAKLAAAVRRISKKVMAIPIHERTAGLVQQIMYDELAAALQEASEYQFN